MVTWHDIFAWGGGAFGLLLLWVSFLTLWRHSRGFDEAFRRFARHRGGEAETRFFRFPEARVPHGAGTAVVRGAFASQYSTNYIEAEIDAPAPWPGRITAFPHGYYAAALTLFHGKRFRTGDPSFDRAFVVFGSPPEMGEAVFDAEARETLVNAGDLGRRGDVLVVLHPTALRVRKHNVTPEPDVIEGLVRAAELLFGKVEALRTGHLEIEYVESPEEKLAGACPVCGSALDRDVVWCRSCRTPHHRECWKFNRACASYGCGSPRFTKTGPGK